MRGKILLFLVLLFALIAVLAQFYPFDRTPPEVSIQPPPGTYNEAVHLTITSEEGALAYYSVGDQDPLPYLGPVVLSRDSRIRYFARDKAGNESEVETAMFNIRVDTEPPVSTAQPRGGRYNHPVTVHLRSEKDAVIHYTLNGNDPDTKSPVYSNALALREDATLKFFGIDQAGNSEKINTERYRISVDSTKPVTMADPSGGLFNKPVTVSLVGEKGTRIYYTLDGSRPSVRSKSYSKPVTFSRSGVLRFFAVDDAGNRENVREESYIIDTVPPRVQIDPPAGTYGKPVKVKLTSTEKGKIRFETGGREPGTFSPFYTGPVEIIGNNTLKYYATDEAGNRGPVSVSEFIIDTTPPATVARPPGGNYSGRIRVKLETSEPADVFYTTDGSPPTSDSSRYRGPISVSKNLVLSFFAVDKVGNQSEVVDQRYILDKKAPITKADPPGGMFAGPINVTLKTEEGAVIHYTIDGSTPIEASPVYMDPLSISRDTVLKFYATDESGNSEGVKVIRYTFDTSPPSTAATPAPGTYNRSISVSLKSERDGRIFLRMDGDQDFSPYRGPFVLDKGGKIFFYAEDPSGNREAVQMAEYVIDTEPPHTIPYPAPGQYNPPITFELKSEKGSKVRYTLDGSEPTDLSPLYTVPLVLKDDVTVKFFSVDPAGNREKVRSAQYTVSSGLWRNNTNGIFIHPSVLDGDYLWVGGEEGLFRVGIRSKKRKNYTISHGLISNSVRAIAIDRLGFKWIGTSKGVSQFDGKSNWVTFDYSDGLPSNFINCIVVDQNGFIWFGTDSGLSRYDGKSFRNFTVEDGLPDNNINSLAIDANGVFWIATEKGLARYSGKVTKVFTRAEGLPSDQVLSVAVDGRWDIWIGTRDKGIARYDGNKWTTYGPVMGFSGRKIPIIAVDLADNKWFNSEQGIFKFNGRRFSLVSMPIYR
ncbi:hypothetical protein EP232_01270 [bacterium]|nr:MAG: hypothetical protein EP232_01270 [bacterium]